MTQIDTHPTQSSSLLSSLSGTESDAKNSVCLTDAMETFFRSCRLYGVYCVQVLVDADDRQKMNEQLANRMIHGGFLQESERQQFVQMLTQALFTVESVNQVGLRIEGI